MRNENETNWTNEKQERLGFEIMGEAQLGCFDFVDLKPIVAVIAAFGFARGAKQIDFFGYCYEINV